MRDHRQDEVRDPKQARSQKRVDSILKATKKLILSKGWAAVSMSDIATEADITISSIYQYFPNRSAIIEALLARYLDQGRENFHELFPSKPKDFEDLSNRILQLLDAYYQLYRSEPVLRDIWTGMASEKAIKDLDADDTRFYVDNIYDLSKHLFLPESRDEVKNAIHILISFAGPAVAIAVSQSIERGSRTINLTKAMLAAAFNSVLLPLAIKEVASSKR
ncbi:MAG: TetR/AcrR family transcriptional regulator [Pseudomonadota bacterium]